MLKPSVEVRDAAGLLVAEFWDCLRLDPSPVQDLKRHFEAHIRRKGRPSLAVDLNGVGFAGSAALGGFLAIHRLAKKEGGRVVFCNVDPDVFEVFRVSKLDSLFSFATDLAAALAALSTTPEAGAGPAAGPPVGGNSPRPSPPTSPRRDNPR